MEGQASVRDTSRKDLVALDSPPACSSLGLYRSILIARWGIVSEIAATSGSWTSRRSTFHLHVSIVDFI